MSHPLTIDVPEEVFSYLNKLALQQGKIGPVKSWA